MFSFHFFSPPNFSTLHGFCLIVANLIDEPMCVFYIDYLLNSISLNSRFDLDFCVIWYVWTCFHLLDIFVQAFNAFLWVAERKFNGHIWSTEDLRYCTSDSDKIARKKREITLPRSTGQDENSLSIQAKQPGQAGEKYAKLAYAPAGRPCSDFKSDVRILSRVGVECLNYKSDRN